jgi:uncharacterized membrane protein
MQNLGGNMNEMFDLQDLPKKAPGAAGGCLAALGGLLAFVGFFLNWYSFPGASGSGLKLATDGDQTLYCCIPCLGLLIVLVGLALAATPFLRREIPFAKPVIAGVLALLPAFLLCPIFLEREGAAIGWWCAPVGAVLVALGAVITLVVPVVMQKDVSQAPGSGEGN